MREIKFRAWDESNKKMTQPFELGSVLCEQAGFFDEIMQFTGFKDNQEHEIYEGDIIVVRGLVKSSEVIWQYGGWMLNNGGALSLFHNDALTVVGNIYENPELLKEKK